MALLFITKPSCITSNSKKKEDDLQGQPLIYLSSKLIMVQAFNSNASDDKSVKKPRAGVIRKRPQLAYSVEKLVYEMNDFATQVLKRGLRSG
jgi:hypothetical protein